MLHFIREFRKNLDWKEFRENWKFMSHDLDVKDTIWGRKVRACRPLLLSFSFFTLLLNGLEMQSCVGCTSPEIQFYVYLRNLCAPHYYIYLDLKPL